MVSELTRAKVDFPLVGNDLGKKFSGKLGQLRPSYHQLLQALVLGDCLERLRGHNTEV